MNILLRMVISKTACGSSIPGIPYITDCVMAEIEKLGMKYRVALRYNQVDSTLALSCRCHRGKMSLNFLCLYRIAKDPRFERLPCTHKGTYADDCLVQRVTQVTYLHLDLMGIMMKVDRHV